MNSIQSVLDSAHQRVGRIQIEIEREHQLLPEDVAPISAFKITDDGVGFNDVNFDSFNTSFSELKLYKGGKGLGRFTWLKAFDAVEVDSTFAEPDSAAPLRRNFIFDNNYEPDAGIAVEAPGRPIGTVIRLSGLKELYQSQILRSADQIAQNLVEHFLLIFLDSNCPSIEIVDGSTRISANDVFEKDFRKDAYTKSFSIKGQLFQLHGFRLSTPRLAKSKLVFAANQRGVLSENLGDYLPNLNRRLIDLDGNSFVYLAIVQGDYLTQRVNASRTDFDIGTGEDSDTDQKSIFEDEIKRSEIRNECVKFIEQDLSSIIRSINDEKTERIRAYVHDDAPQYKILLKDISEFIDTISPAATKTELEAALHRELHQREVTLRQESTRILKDTERLDDYDQYQERIFDFLDDYNELGVSALAQYVAHRKIILEFLERAISKTEDDIKFPLEKVVHQLVFPRAQTSEEITYGEQNLWIIDERLTYHSFIASDKSLTSLSTVESSSAKRGDLVIFDQKILFAEGEHPVNSITVVEFKRPQRDDYTAQNNPLLQCLELVDDIRTSKFKGANGRPIPVSNENIPAVCHVVCDITPSLRKALKAFDATPTPDGQGYYGYHQQYGAYYEVIDYSKLLRDAKKRNRIFFEKLNFNPKD